MLSILALAAALSLAGSAVAQSSTCPDGTTTITSPYCTVIQGAAPTACYNAADNTVSCTFLAYTEGLHLRQ